jgi:two-component system response regulator MprA
MGIRELLGQVLESEGYTVELAADGQLALDRLRAAPGRMVVLLDVMMPVLDGVRVLETVAADDTLARRHGFVVMTASAQSPDGSLLRLARQFDAPVLTKPFSIETMLTCMGSVAGRLRDN